MIKVLIIDDDKLARKGLVSLVDWESFGMSIVGDVQNGATGLQFIKENPVDLVFVDIDMPEMNGIEFMEQCRELKPEVQFVVLSFFEEFSYVQATLRLGGLDYISKTSMELDNFDTVLRRIAEKYQSRMSKQQSHQDEEADLEEIRAEFASRFWLYDDCAFIQLEEKVRKVHPDPPTIRRIEMYLARYIGEIEEMLDVPEKKIPLFEEMEKLIEWVKDYRRMIYEIVENGSLGSDAQRVLKAVIYMKKHLAEELSTSAVAEYIGCSRSYFCIIFKRFSGLSFGDFLQQIRIDHAKELLAGTEESVTEIAFLSGYRDIYYFNRVFQKIVQCSPRDFRRQACVKSDFEK